MPYLPTQPPPHLESYPATLPPDQITPINPLPYLPTQPPPYLPTQPPPYLESYPANVTLAPDQGNPEQLDPVNRQITPKDIEENEIADVLLTYIKNGYRNFDNVRQYENLERDLLKRSIDVVFHSKKFNYETTQKLANARVGMFALSYYGGYLQLKGIQKKNDKESRINRWMFRKAEVKKRGKYGKYDRQYMKKMEGIPEEMYFTLADLIKAHAEAKVQIGVENPDDDNECVNALLQLRQQNEQQNEEYVGAEEEVKNQSIMEYKWIPILELLPPLFQKENLTETELEYLEFIVTQWEARNKMNERKHHVEYK